MQRLVHGAVRSVVALLTVTHSGCWGGGDASTEAGSGWSGQIRDSAGVVFVSNPEAGIWNERSRWSAQRDLVIGAGVADRPEYEFGRIADVDAGADGRIYVLDNQAGRISVFHPDGEYAFAFGRLGQGPGEFSIDASAIRIDSDGTIAVRDGINRRDNLFTAEGAFLRTANLSAQFRESAALPQAGRVERATTATWDGLLHVAADGSVIDTITVFRYDMTRRGGALSSSGRTGRTNTIRIPLLPALPSWGVDDDGRVVAGISSRYRIEVLRSSGALVMVIDKDHDSLLMSSEAGERMLNRVRDLLRNAGLSGDAIAGVFERFTYVPPDSLPAFGDIAGGPSGTVWVQQVLPVDSMTANATVDAFDPGSAIWDVFCSDGRYLGPIALPAGFTVKKIKGSFVYGIETDDLDVQRIVRLVIGPGEAASEDELSC